MTIEIHRIAVPNPFFEGRNSVYLLKGDPITLVDTGVATTKAYDVLCEGLQKHDVAIADIKRVLLTHKHIDHIGNAWQIQQDAGADVYIHKLETKSLTQVDPTGRRFDKLVSDRLQQWKAPLPDPNPDSSDKMPEWELQSCEPIALNDGDELTIDDEPIQVIHTPGHSMGSVCYHVADHFFSGDHVLRAISPNVGAGDLRSSGLLGRFLDSLDRIGHLGDVRIYPGHGSPFHGLSDRCQALRQHHEDRLDKILSIVKEEPHTVYQVAIKLFGELERFHVLLGCAEANSHLEYLVTAGSVAETNGQFIAI